MELKKLKQICHSLCIDFPMGAEAVNEEGENFVNEDFLKEEIEWEFHKFFSTSWYQGMLFFESEVLFAGVTARKVYLWDDAVKPFVNAMGLAWVKSFIKRLKDYGDTPDKEILAHFKEFHIKRMEAKK